MFLFPLTKIAKRKNINKLKITVNSSRLGFFKQNSICSYILDTKIYFVHNILCPSEICQHFLIIIDISSLLIYYFPIFQVLTQEVIGSCFSKILKILIFIESLNN